MRRKYVKGKLEDKNKYFKCPNCGSINRVDRNKPSDRSNITNSEFSVPLDPNNKTFLVIDVFGWIGGVPSSTYGCRQPVVNNGCWFCGCVNF